MKIDDREIIESPLYQGQDEQIIYRLTTTPWGSTPTNVDCSIYIISGSTYTEYSSVLFGATTATVSGDIITTPTVKSLTNGTDYRLEIKFTCSGSIFEPFANIRGQR